MSVGTFRSAADDDASDRDREELKRLLYVAVTRARDRLYLATTLDDRGRFDVAKGGLGDVLPAELRAIFERAGIRRPPRALEWQGASATPSLPQAGTVGAATACQRPRRHRTGTAREFGAAASTPTARFAARISQAGRSRAAATGRPEPPGDAADPRRLGTLVHRLLEQRRASSLHAIQALEALAERLLGRDDRRAVADSAALTTTAALQSSGKWPITRTCCGALRGHAGGTRCRWLFQRRRHESGEALPTSWSSTVPSGLEVHRVQDGTPTALARGAIGALCGGSPGARIGPRGDRPSGLSPGLRQGRKPLAEARFLFTAASRYLLQSGCYSCL